MLTEAAASTYSGLERETMDDPQAAEAPDLQTLAYIGADATAAGSIARG